MPTSSRDLLKSGGVEAVCGDCGKTYRKMAFASWCDDCSVKRREKREAAEHRNREEQEMIRRDDFVRRFPDWTPRKYRERKLSDFANTIAEKFPSGPESVRLVGPCGTGKTALACAWLNERARFFYTMHWSPPVFRTATQILIAIRATFRRESEQTEDEVITALCSHDCLVIDDLGAENSTDFANSILLEVIDRRIRECRFTVVTSNMTLAEMNAKDPRQASRMLEFWTVDLSGQPDRRVEAAKARASTS